MMEKKVETTRMLGLYWGHIGVIIGLYRHNGKSSQRMGYVGVI